MVGRQLASAPTYRHQVLLNMGAEALDVLVYITVTVVAALNGTSGCLPLTVGLIGLIVWQSARDMEARTFFTPLALALGLTISLAITIPGVVAGSALDRAQLIIPAAALIALFVYAITFASIKATQRFRDTRIEQSITILLFPLLWTVSWAIFCRIHSLGRLVSWTPLREIGPFYSMASAFGMPGLDFLIALMAVTVVEILGGLKYDEQPLSPLIDYSPSEHTRLLPGSFPRSVHSGSSKTKRSKFRRIALLSFFFVWWSIAGIVRSNLVTPATDLHSTKLACVLPHASSSNGRLSLADYVEETERVTGMGAKIVQWPESAVHLNTIPDKIAFVKSLQSLAERRRAFIATSYTFLDEDDSERSTILTSMFGPDKEIVYTYAKQALVPVAETYRSAPGTRPLPRETIIVPESRQPHRPHPHGQNITISTAICHDTSFNNIVRQAYPASLVLVPSSVYSERVAWTRIYQLRANARALSTAFLVCDGNRQGISAFIESTGDLRYWQKGPGSFEISTSTQAGARTAYGAYGDIGSIGILFACLLGCAVLEVMARIGIGRVVSLYHQAKEALKHRFQAHYGTIGRQSTQDNNDLL